MLSLMIVQIFQQAVLFSWTPDSASESMPLLQGCHAAMGVRDISVFTDKQGGKWIPAVNSLEFSIDTLTHPHAHTHRHTRVFPCIDKW